MNEKVAAEKLVIPLIDFFWVLKRNGNVGTKSYKVLCLKFPILWQGLINKYI